MDSVNNWHLSNLEISYQKPVNPRIGFDCPEVIVVEAERPAVVAEIAQAGAIGEAVVAKRT